MRDRLKPGHQVVLRHATLILFRLEIPRTRNGLDGRDVRPLLLRAATNHQAGDGQRGADREPVEQWHSRLPGRMLV